MLTRFGSFAGGKFEDLLFVLIRVDWGFGWWKLAGEMIVLDAVDEKLY
jgi:hypothetical protein